MSEWIDFVKKVAKRDKISYTKALTVASGEYKKTKTGVSKGTKSKTMKGKLDFTTKKGDVKDEGGKRMKGKKAK
tara:strand:- start:5736 stop:5957 length:222 start_codon:yes stop_codon:yes gene_type:complete